MKIPKRNRARRATVESVADAIATYLCRDLQGRSVERLVIEYTTGPKLDGPGWSQSAIKVVALRELCRLARGKGGRKG